MRPLGRAYEVSATPRNRRKRTIITQEVLGGPKWRVRSKRGAWAVKSPHMGQRQIADCAFRTKTRRGSAPRLHRNSTWRARQYLAAIKIRPRLIASRDRPTFRNSTSGRLYKAVRPGIPRSAALFRYCPTDHAIRRLPPSTLGGPAFSARQAHQVQKKSFDLAPASRWWWGPRRVSYAY